MNIETKARLTFTWLLLKITFKLWKRKLVDYLTRNHFNVLLLEVNQKCPRVSPRSKTALAIYIYVD